MTRINTNVSSLVAQNRLQSSNQDLNSALTRLSTGLRINKGSDDPAGLIASEALRSEITSIGKSVANTRRASQIISTADSALGQVSNLLNDIRGLVVEAASDGALASDEIAANQLQLDSSLEAINRIAQTTTFQGRKLLDGSLDFVTQNGVGSSNLKQLSIDQASLGSNSSIDVDINVQAAATKAELSVSGFSAAVTAAPASATITFNTPVHDAGSSEAFTLTQDTADDAANGLTFTVVEATGHGSSPTASVDASGNITLTIDDGPGGTDFDDIEAELNTLAGFSVTRETVGFTPSNFYLTIEPEPIDGTFGGGIVADDGGITADVVFELQGSSGSEVFNIKAGTSLQQVIDQINLVTDATGVSASADGDDLKLNSETYGSDSLVDLRVLEQDAGGTFTSTRQSGTDIVATANGRSASGSGNSISINTSTLSLSASVAADFTGSAQFTIKGGGAQFQLGPDVVSNQQARIGINSVSSARLGGASGKLYQLGSGESASLAKDSSKAAQIVNEAIAQVNGLRGRLGAFQSTTLDSNLVSLNETAANLQEAESSIRDADFAQESAKLTRAQILVQSGTNVLSLANQNPQNVLSLLR
ncbi:flagellin N-terminal helical domain-containing protein [Rubripirellula reticaptiva]|uniref:Flagellin n=1 Tax=Rubripirellula reticaptiva TaxID=2528013 RepID=A0A5C6F1T1_9BACT|nr:flagellin [Rubripirellula reticaptiva]TWU55318.1 B-type flagellin [Rubripirellula reticaptiva]